MKRFQNILFVVQGDDIPVSAMEQAAQIVKINDCEFTVLVMHSDLPDSLQDVEDAYEKNIESAIREKLEELGLNKDSHIRFETTRPRFMTIIQHVLKHDYDLLVKPADNLDEKQDKGFKSLDMNLLRKCPCPVWLCRDLKQNTQPNIITAIDPFSVSEEGYDLSIKLLQIGQSLAANLNATNSVVSCWNFEDEDFLRNSGFAKMDSSKVDALVAEACEKHNTALDDLVAKANIEKPNVICERGQAYDVIPTYIETENIDIVVMGTIARTGIPGFIIGNTAENILQNIACGMFAIKPTGFVSPVKA